MYDLVRALETNICCCTIILGRCSIIFGSNYEPDKSSKPFESESKSKKSESYDFGLDNNITVNKPNVYNYCKSKTSLISLFLFHN